MPGFTGGSPREGWLVSPVARWIYDNYYNGYTCELIKMEIEWEEDLIVLQDKSTSQSWKSLLIQEINAFFVSALSFHPLAPSTCVTN